MKSLNDVTLDLNDPNVVEALKATDVTKVPEPTKADKDTAKKIADLQKGASVTVKLTTQQLANVIRQAASVDQPWKDWFLAQVENEILGRKVQSPTINGPSWVNTKITGPSKWMQK